MAQPKVKSVDDEEKHELQSTEKKTKKPKKKLKKIKVDTIEEGDNKLYPKHGDIVIINYVSKYYGGDCHKKQIDSGSNKTFKIGRKQVIDGWEQCMIANKLSLGSKVKIKMPHEFCYGYHIDIPFGQDMLFEIELLQINDRKR
eukprot:869248_1